MGQNKRNRAKTRQNDAIQPKIRLKLFQNDPRQTKFTQNDPKQAKISPKLTQVISN